MRRLMTSPMFRVAVAGILLVAVYFVVPVNAADSYPVARWTAMVACVAAVALVMLRQVGKALADPAAPYAGLLLSIILGALAFALLDYTVAIRYPDQFASLHTRVDALYFAVATVTTIGYGDVHAEGQVARLIVTAQMVFNAVVLGIAISVLASQMKGRVKDRTTRE